jgi:hypothetical protein
VRARAEQDSANRKMDLNKDRWMDNLKYSSEGMRYGGQLIEGEKWKGFLCVEVIYIDSIISNYALQNHFNVLLCSNYY